MNVLNDPWIPVRTQENQHIRVTLPDFYAHAHEYRSLETENAFDEFSLARFLALFAHCAYEPKSEGDLEDMAEDGHFPMKPIYDYIALCQSEGVTFELFDKERPFLQAVPDKDSSKKKGKEPLDNEKRKHPIAMMDFVYANNKIPIHRYQKFEEEYAYRVEDCPIKLLSQYVYSRHKAAGLNGRYDSSPAGTPTFFLPNTENLFLNILFAIPLVDKDRINEKEFWRRSQDSEEEIIKPSKELTATPSLRYGMIFPCRRIVLNPPEEDGLVHTCYYQPGLFARVRDKKTDEPLWLDNTSTTYQEVKKNQKKTCQFYLHYDYTDLDAVYRILTKGPDVPKCIDFYTAYFRKKGEYAPPYVAFVTEDNQADYTAARKILLKLPPAVLNNSTAHRFLQDFLIFARGKAYSMLYTAMQEGIAAQNSYNLSGYLEEYREQIMKMFDTLMYELLEEIDRTSISFDEIRNRLPSLFEKISELALATFDRAMPELSMSVLNLYRIENQRNRLYWFLRKTKEYYAEHGDFPSDENKKK